MEKKLNNLQNIIIELQQLIEKIKNLSAEDKTEFNKKLIEISKKYPDMTEFIYFIIYLEDKNSLRDNHYLNHLLESLEKSNAYKSLSLDLYRNFYEKIQFIENELNSLKNINSFGKIKEFLKTLKINDIKIILIEFIITLILISALLMPEKLESLFIHLEKFIKLIL